MIQKLKEWEYFDNIVDIGIAVCVILIGTYALYLHNNLLPCIYFVFGGIVLFFFKNLILKTILAGFPIIFLIYYLEWKWLAVYLLMVSIWYTVHKYSYEEKGGT